MAHHDEAPVIHKNALRGAGALVLLTILGAGWSAWNGPPSVMDPTTAVLVVRELRFVDDDGAVIVQEGEDVIAVLASGEGQFIRGVVRALARHRMLSDVGREAPFKLVHRADGRLTLEDPETGEAVVINAFGSANLQAFARLLDAEDRVGFESSIPRTMENEA